MSLKIYKPYHGGEWGIALQYLKDGVLHVPLMDFVQPWNENISDEKDELELDYNFRFQLNAPYQDYLVFSLTPRERIEGFVYGGVRVKRSCVLTDVAEQEFLEIEKTLHNYNPDNPGYIREIWKYYFTETWRGIKTYTEHPDGKCTVIKSPLETIRK